METEIKNAVREYFEGRLGASVAAGLDDSTPLIESGYLTSLQTVELVLFLEERLGLEVGPEAVTEENFSSIDSIANFLAAAEGVKR